MADYPVDEFRDSTSLTAWTMRLLYLHLAMSIIGALSGILEMQVLHAIGAGAFESDEALKAAASANDARQRAVGITQAAVFLVCGVVTLRWIHRACFNARVRATVMEFTPGWSVGYYFIPIMNLWKPYQAMKEIWETTAVQADKVISWGGALLGWWWALWLISNAIANAAFRMTMRAETLDEYLLSDKLMLASDLIDLPLTIVFILIVRNLSAMQEVVRASPPRPVAAVPGANW